MRSVLSRAAAACLLVVSFAGCSSEAEPDPEGSGSGSGDLVEVPGVHVDGDSAALSPDGSQIAVPCDGRLCVWDTADGALADTWDGGSVVAWSPRGDVVATDGLDGETVRVVLLDAATGQESASFETGKSVIIDDDPGGGLLDLKFSPDGETLAGVGGDGVVRLWSVSDPSDEMELDLEGEQPQAVAFSPDGTSIAVASSDAPVTIRDVESGDEIGVLDAAPQGAVAWSPDGAWIAAASHALDGDAATTIWDSTALTLVTTLHRAGDVLAFSPSRDALALSEKNERDVLTWSWHDDDLQTLSGATDAPRTVLWSPDGSRVYAVSPRDTVLAWDADGGSPTSFEKLA